LAEIAINFMKCPAGHIDFGLIERIHAEAIGVEEGPIRLQVGYKGNTGFGYLHVQEKWERMRQLEGLGFKDAESYCSQVAKNYTRICAGKDGRLVLVWPNQEFDLTLVVERKEGDPAYWTIVTAIPKRVERSQVLQEVARTGGREPSPDIAKRPRFATLSLPKKF